MGSHYPIWHDIKDNRYTLLVLTILGIAVHATLWLGWSLHSGADGRSYVMTYLTAFGDYENSYYSMVYFRGILPSILHGFTLSVGVWLNIVIQTLMALSAVVMVYLLLLPWKKLAAWLGAITFLLYVPVQLLFHQVSSEGSFAWATLLVLLIFRHVITQKKPVWWMLLGLAIGTAYLARVSAMAFLILLSARLFQGGKRTTQLRDILLAIFSMMIVLAPWVIYRGIKFDYFALARSNGTLLFTSAYNFNLIQPENGQYTEQFIELIEEHLLSSAAYQDEKIDLDHVLSPDSHTGYSKWAYYNDLVYILDMFVGWNEAHTTMNNIGMEALQAHPQAFLERTVKAVGSILQIKAYPSFAEPTGVDVNRLRPIPLYGIFYLTYPEHVNPPNPDTVVAINQKTAELIMPLTRINSDFVIAERVQNYWLRYFPQPMLFYLFCLLALLRSRNVSILYLSYILLVAFAVIVPSTMIAEFVRYRLVVDSVFIIGFAVGISEVYGFYCNRVRVRQTGG